jgi:hypothetical protein
VLRMQSATRFGGLGDKIRNGQSCWVKIVVVLVLQIGGFCRSAVAGAYWFDLDTERINRIIAIIIVVALS